MILRRGVGLTGLDAGNGEVVRELRHFELSRLELVVAEQRERVLWRAVRLGQIFAHEALEICSGGTGPPRAKGRPPCEELGVETTVGRLREAVFAHGARVLAFERERVP